MTDAWTLFDRLAVGYDQVVPLARRLLSCLAAREAATTVYLEDGSLTG